MKVKDAVFVGTGEVAGGVGCGGMELAWGRSQGDMVTATGLVAFYCHKNWTVCILLS